MSAGSLASSALSFRPGETGSLAVIFAEPRLTKIQPFSPMNRTPFGNLSQTRTGVPSGYVSVMSYSPWTSHSPPVWNTPLPSTYFAPIFSHPMPQWTMSRWCEPQPVIMPAPNCSQRNQPGRELTAFLRSAF